jgi:hypothetical protein
LTLEMTSPGRTRRDCAAPPGLTLATTAAAELSHSAIVSPSVPSRVKMAVWKVASSVQGLRAFGFAVY